MHIFNKMLFFHYTCIHITFYVSKSMANSTCLELKVNLQQQVLYKLKGGVHCNGLYFGIFGRTFKCSPTARATAVNPTLHQGILEQHSRAHMLKFTSNCLMLVSISFFSQWDSIQCPGRFLNINNQDHSVFKSN
jgi:hypothetical protein